MSIMDGWIKLYRQIRQWRWYSDSNVKSLFIHCLLLANVNDGHWHEYDIKQGSFITSLGALSAELGMSMQQIRTALKKLQSSGEIVLKSTNKNTLITICNWASYQGQNEGEQQTNNKQITNEQQTNNKQITTNKNNKERKKDKEEENIIFDDVAFATEQSKTQPTKKTIEEREKDFYDEVAKFVGQYSRDMLRAFFDYWSEPTQNKNKMRFENEKTWETGRRLRTWAKRDEQNSKSYNNGTNQQTDAERLKVPHIGTFTDEQFDAICEMGRMLSKQNAGG